MANYKVFSRTEKSRDISHKLNEDCFLFTEYSFMNDERIKILAVADGIGGLEQGEKASFDAISGFSQSVYQSLLQEYMMHSAENFSMTYYAEKMEEIVKQAVKDANRNVCEQTSPFVETGTTLSVVVILGDYAVLANVGDSPVYYYRSKTKEFQLISSLQTRAEQDVARGKYERYSEEYYENDHIIYSSLGAREELQNEDIFVNVIGYINSGDMFLVGSDGSFGRMKENEIYQIISGEEEYTVLKELFEEARKDKDDDQTAVFYKVCGEEW